MHRSHLKTISQITRLFLLNLLWLFSPFSTLQAAIVFSQGDYAVSQTPQSIVVVTYPAAQAAGNLNVVVVGWGDTNAQILSVTDTGGNAYQLAIGVTRRASAASQAI